MKHLPPIFLERRKRKTKSVKIQNMVCVYATKFCIQVIMHHCV